MDNIYTPPKFRTVTPPVDHLRKTPNYTQIKDEHRKAFFTNINYQLLTAIRRIKNT
jgi:hypothetical protein